MEQLEREFRNRYGKNTKIATGEIADILNRLIEKGEITREDIKSIDIKPMNPEELITTIKDCRRSFIYSDDRPINDLVIDKESTHLIKSVLSAYTLYEKKTYSRSSRRYLPLGVCIGGFLVFLYLYTPQPY